MIFCTISDPFDAFDHQREFHGRSAQFNGRFCVRILRPVYDFGPVHQVVEIRRIENRTFSAPW